LRPARALSAAAIALFLASSGTAFGDIGGDSGDSNIVAARAQFQRGVESFRTGDFEAARLAFLEADRFHPTPVITYNLARVYERLSWLQEAVDGYERYLASAGSRAEYAQAAAVAIADLRSSAARIRFESDVPGAVVIVGGRQLSEPTPTTVLLPAGSHSAAAKLGDRKDLQVFTAARGQAATVRFIVANVAPRETDESGVFLAVNLALAPGWHFASNTGASARSSAGLFGAFELDAGYAVARALRLSLHATAAIGPNCPRFVDGHAVSAGPGVGVGLTRSLILSAHLVGGRSHDCVGGVVLDSDWVFGGRLGMQYDLVPRGYGTWFAVVSATFLAANREVDNASLFVPLGVGLRFQ